MKYNSSNLFVDAFNYFYQNRATINLEPQYITSGDKEKLASRGRAENLDTGEIQKLWVYYGKDYPGEYASAITGVNMTAKYGWYDTENHGKSVVNGGIAVWMLMNTFERAYKLGNAAQLDEWIHIPDITGNAPASENIPKILQECQVELDFFMDMIVKPGAPAGVIYDISSNSNGLSFDATGMVYHKIQSYKWTALGVKPSDDTAVRIVKPPTTAATLNAAATFAQAARLFKPYDTELAVKYLNAAKSTYEAAIKNPQVYTPMNYMLVSNYGNDNAWDEFYWTACELYATTGDERYLKDLENFNFNGQQAYKIGSYIDGSYIDGRVNIANFSSFNWCNTTALGTLSLWLNKDKLPPSKVAIMENSIKETADEFLAMQRKQGYGIPYCEVEFADLICSPVYPTIIGYDFSSNSYVLNNTVVMAYAYDVSRDKRYLDGVAEAMDYIHGRNAMDFSFVTGYGSYHAVNPSHRFWVHEIDSDYPYAPAGVISSGPNIGMQDPYICGAGLSSITTPSQFAFIDSVESWSTNEANINLNAPYIWILKYLNDEVGANGIAPPTIIGDLNFNKEIDTADLIILAKYLSGRASLTNQQFANAKCASGTGINSDDLLALIKYLTGEVKSLPI